MSTTFPTDWISSPSAAPSEHRATAERLAAFADGPTDRATADTLAKTAGDAPLEALVAFLERRQDGLRLALLQSASLPKGARKAAGRAIHSLKARGIACEVPEGRTGGIAYTVEVQPSALGLPLPNGLSFAILSDLVHGEPKTGVFIMHELDGLIEAAPIEPTKSRIRKAMEHLVSTAHEDGFPMTFVDAPESLIRVRINEAIARSHAAKKPLPPETARLELLIGPATAPGPHPALTVFATGPLPEESQAVGLLGHSHAGGGYHVGIADAAPPVEEGWLDASRARLLEATGTEALEDPEQRAKFDAALAAIVDEVFDEARRARDGQRLLDVAYVLAREGMRDAGGLAFVTAQALGDATRAASTIPWASQAVLRWLRPQSHVVDHGHDHG